MVSLVRSISFVLGLGLSSLALADSVKWISLGVKDGAQTYEAAIPGTALFAFKGTKTMNIPITKLAGVLLDERAEVRKNWVDLCNNFVILEKYSPYHAVTYSSYDLPWPIADRDYVLDTALTINNDANEIVVDLKSVEHAKAPGTVGVRAYLTKSLYKLVPKPNNTTEVTVEIQTDPKGELPKWLVNLIQRSWPSNTLKKLEAQALKPDTKESELIKKEFKAARELVAH